MDEPGLSWGPTPAGGSASGFPNHDEQPWYEAKGWKYTQDIANCTDEEWMKYMRIRCSILGDNFWQARNDIKTVWPEAIYSTNSYALQAIMDGTDSINQLANDIPSSHIFFDFYGGPMTVTGHIQLEKAATPYSKLAHAMNGQLTGARGPQRPLYHLLMGGILQGGVYSNWWLNIGGMSTEDLTAVNTPAAEMGPLFKEMELKGYDIALLWSFTEQAMRQKEIVARESKATGGNQIPLVLPIPDADNEFSLLTNSYEVGVKQVVGVLAAHQVMRRAGYPVQIVDERLLPDGVLRNGYKVLMIIGQTMPLPAPVMQAITEFVEQGGTVVADQATTINFPGMLRLEMDNSANAQRTLIAMNSRSEKAAENKRDASVYLSYEGMYNPFYRQSVAPMKAVLGKTKAQQVVRTDALDLSIDQHTAGEGRLVTILNGHEAFAENLAPEKEHPRYNPAPYSATVTLATVKPGEVVYCIEGFDWKTARKLDNPTAPLKLEFAAGEMKLFLVLPKAIEQISATAEVQQGVLKVQAAVHGAKTPWPITVTVTGPDDMTLLQIQRAMNAEGAYAENIPLGSNAAAGAYTVKIESLPGNLQVLAQVDVTQVPMTPTTITEKVRIFDEAAIRAQIGVWKDTPGDAAAVIIAVANEEQRPLAEKLATALWALKIRTELRDEAQVLRKGVYPRVWNPTATVFHPGENMREITGEVKLRLSTKQTPNGMVVTDEEGKTYADWKQPEALVTIGEGGLADWISKESETVYAPGCVIYVNAKKAASPLNTVSKREDTTPEFRKTYAAAWNSLINYSGGYQYPPVLPDAYVSDDHLIVMGDSTSSMVVRILQASEILPQIVDAKYPGPGKALIQFAWSPFAVEKNVVLLGASEVDGLQAAIDTLLSLLR